MKFLLIIWSAIFSRMAGGGVWTKRPPGLGEALFALPIVYGFHHVAFHAAFHNPHHIKEVLTGAAFLWAYLWMQTGHAVAFHMNSGVEHDAAGGRMNELSYVVNPICRALGKPIGGDFFCWIFMGLKGLLVHAPLGLFALPAAALWPAAYFIGNRIVPRLDKTVDGEMIAEFLAGAFSGLCVALSLIC